MLRFVERGDVIEKRGALGIDSVVPAPPSKKYQRVGQLFIRPLLLRKEQSPYDLARLMYDKCNEAAVALGRVPDLDFDKDLDEYHRDGFVISRPTIFGMFRPIAYEGERIWFIRIAIGDLLELVSCFPCMLPKIAFCRNNQPDKMVVCDTKRLIEIAKMKAETHGRRNGN